MKWTAYGTRILITELPAVQKEGLNLSNSLVLTRGQVVSAGHKVVSNLKSGDLIEYKKENAYPIFLDGQEYFIIEERDIWIVSL